MFAADATLYYNVHMNTKRNLPPFVLLLALLLAACGSAQQPAPAPTAADPGVQDEATSMPVVEIQSTDGQTDLATSTPIRISVATSTPVPESPDQQTVEATSLPTEEPASPPDDEVIDPSEPLYPVATILNDANLRAGPGTDFAVVAEIKAGQQIFVEAQNPAGDWIQLNMEGPDQTWIATFLLDLPAGLVLPIAADIPPPPPSPTPGDFVVIQESTTSIPTYPWQHIVVEGCIGCKHDGE